jgi:hypothetical protein
MAECVLPGFAATTETLYCGTHVGDVNVQVTHSRVQMMSCASHAVVASWSPEDGSRITLATGNATQVRVDSLLSPPSTR